MSLKRFAAIISLGCAKNLVDSETMAAQLVREGYVLTSDPGAASLIVVNTCGFLQSAVEEAVETILEHARYKTDGACDTLVAAGCMVQRYGKKLLALLPEVDLFLGVSHFQELARAVAEIRLGDARRLRIGRPGQALNCQGDRLLTAPAHSAYLKIADGCGNRCAYCLIPRLRGPYRSRSLEDVVTEAAELADRGVVELNVIAQDTTAFGQDRGQERALIALIEELERLEGLKWVRILYAYPDRVDEPLLSAMRSATKVVPYLDMPVQHCAPSVLKAMGRKGDVEGLGAKIHLIRRYIPEITLRTSLMVGFPGETEEDFELLLGFVDRAAFDHVGVFAFSLEPGARAARLPGQVEESEKVRRRTMLLEAQREVSRRRLSRFVGRRMEVLMEGFHPETDLLLQGRTAHQAPEVDGVVIINDGIGGPGQIREVLITDSHEYDLVGSVLPEPCGEGCSTSPREGKTEGRRGMAGKESETL